AFYAQVRFIRTPAAYRISIAETWKGQRQLNIDQLEDARKHSLSHGINLFERGEAHLDVELRKFRLAVGAQILVAKTTRDLKILVESGNHAELFEQLRRLRQRKKL